MLKLKTKEDTKIFLPEEIYSYLGKEVYVGISFRKKRIIIFKRSKYENLSINNLIYPSEIDENGCVTIPFKICSYLGWDFSDALEFYRISDYIVIEPFF